MAITKSKKSEFHQTIFWDPVMKIPFCLIVLGIGLKNQNRLIGNSEQSIIDYNRFSACFVRKTEYSFLPNIITVVFR